MEQKRGLKVDSVADYSHFEPQIIHTTGIFLSIFFIHLP